MDKRMVSSVNNCKKSLFDLDSLNNLTLMNLDNEGALILQEMYEAIKLALVKGTQLEEIILKRNGLVPSNKYIKITPCGAGGPKKLSTENKTVSTAPEVTEEPIMPLPFVIKTETLALDTDFEQHSPNANSSGIELNICMFDTALQSGTSELSSEINNLHSTRNTPVNYVTPSVIARPCNPTAGLLPFPSSDLVCSVSSQDCLTPSQENLKPSDTIVPSLHPLSSTPDNSFNIKPQQFSPTDNDTKPPDITTLPQISSEFLHLTAYVSLDVNANHKELKALYDKEGLIVTSIRTNATPSYTRAIITFINEEHLQKCLALNKKLTLKGKIVSSRNYEPPRKIKTLGNERSDTSHHNSKHSNAHSSKSPYNTYHRSQKSPHSSYERNDFSKDDCLTYRPNNSRDTYRRNASSSAHSSHNRQCHPYRDIRDMRR